MDPPMNPAASSSPPSSLPPPQLVPFSDAVPPYPQMIIDAITALKERGGSSRHAIGKQIESVYSNSLPSNHRRLLTYHLDKMKADRSLGMVKHSYSLGGDVDSTHKRRPGRPRKAKNPDEPSGPQPNAKNCPDSEAQPNADNMLVCHAQPNAVNVLDSQAQPISVPIADVDDTPKRGRGRPPKKAAMQGDRPSGGQGQVKKRRKLSGNGVGRPKKNNDLVPATQEAYQDLKNKLEYFQSRVKQAVYLVRPYFTSETSPRAYGALQELEELANVPMTAPTRAPSQQPLAPS